MNRKLTLITMVVSAIIFGQTQCDPLKKAIEKHDVKTVQWLIHHAHLSNSKLTQSQKDEYVQLANEQVTQCKLAHESRSIGSIISDLDESECYSLAGGTLLAAGGILAFMYSAYGFAVSHYYKECIEKHDSADKAKVDPALAATVDHAKSWKSEWKGCAGLLLGAGATVKGLGDLVKAFGGHKTKDNLKKAEAIKTYIDLLPVEEVSAA